MQHIKAIIFDFGGVILNIDFNKTCQAFNDIGVKDFADMYSLKNANPLFQHLEEGKLSDEDFYITFRKLSNTDLTDEQIKIALNLLLLTYRREALNTLKAIRHKYKLFLLSNTNNIHLQAFTKLYKEQIGKGSLDDYFDKAYYSHKTGYRKPAKEAYEMVLQENNLSASETMFIDDSIKNIEGARAVGLQTILLEAGIGIEDLSL